MVSSVQVVFLIDVNYLKYNAPNEELKKQRRKLLLCCLRLITEFGAHCDKGNENIRWSFKFYDSKRFKPDISQKLFNDFNKASVFKFEDELEKITHHSHSFNKMSKKETLESSLDSRQSKPNIRSSNTTTNGVPLFDERPNSNNRYNSHNLGLQEKSTHSYILKKCLQEILLDYDWDRPDISSPVRKSKLYPVKSSKRGRCSRIKPTITSDEFNFVIVFTHIPHNLKELEKFIGKPPSSETDFFNSFFDKSTLYGFQEEKRLRLHLINISPKPIDLDLKTIIQNDLSKVSGRIHEFSNLVQNENYKMYQELISPHLSIFVNNELNKPIKGIEFNLRNIWFGFNYSVKSLITSQNKSILIWEDENGISFLKLNLKCYDIKGSYKHLGNIRVSSFIHGRIVPILGLGLSSSLMYICHAPNTVFPLLLSILSEQNLIMILQFESGGLAGLVPWVNGTGCLVIFSITNLITPVTPINVCEKEEISSNLSDTKLNAFVKQCLTKVLKRSSIISIKEKSSSCVHFQPQVLRPWYPHMLVAPKALPMRPSKVACSHPAMFERLQKKYRPQLPRPLSGSLVPSAPALVDATDPAAAAAVPGVGMVAPHPLNSNQNVSRAQKLVKKSKIITAQMRVEEQKAEEREQQAESERKVAEAQSRARKSLAFAAKMQKIDNPQDKDEVAATLALLLDSPSSPSPPEGPDGSFQSHKEDTLFSEDEELYGTAQAIINLALMHIKANFASATGYTMQNELQDLLSRGILLSTRGVVERYPQRRHLTHFKLQVLLRLEILWVLGYSPSTLPSEENTDVHPRQDFGRDCVQAILRLLRAVSLKFNPSILGEFLQRTVAPNYYDFLGDTLKGIFEELNQPLTGSMDDTVYTNQDGNQDSPFKSPSAKSHIGSIEEPNCGGPTSLKGALPVRSRLQRETSHRQIIVSRVRMQVPRGSGQPLGKKDEAKRVAPQGSQPKTELKRVCRNLFAKSNPKREAFTRSHTIASGERVPASSSFLSSPFRRKENKNIRRWSEAGSGEKAEDPDGKKRCFSRKVAITPTRCKSIVRVPETPLHCFQSTVFDRNRSRKSAGITVVTESPDIKGGDDQSKMRRTSLPLARRNSFYSGAISRNFERGKRQVQASQLKGASTLGLSHMRSESSPTSSSFIFSEIVQSNSRVECSSIAPSPEYVKLSYGVEEFTTGQGPLDVSIGKTPTRQSPHTPMENRSSAIERELGSPMRRVRRSLSLFTPVKAPTVPKTPLSEDSGPSLATLKRKSSLKEIKGNGLGVVERLGDSDPKVSPNLSFSDYLTPSKKVQFSFEETPSKLTPNKSGSAMPKSILKTPNKSPHRTPIKIDSLRKFLTPNKAILDSLRNFQDSLTIFPEKEKVHSNRVSTSVTLSPRQKENSLPSKIVTQFRNSTPQQFELLLHSPITSSLKKVKPLNEVGDTSSQPFGASSIKNHPRKLLSPFNTSIKQSPSPSKVVTNWDFKPLVGSPVKLLLDSAIELEITSPLKSSCHSAKTDLVIHQEMTDKETFRSVGQIDIRHDIKTILDHSKLGATAEESFEKNGPEKLNDPMLQSVGSVTSIRNAPPKSPPGICPTPDKDNQSPPIKSPGKTTLRIESLRKLLTTTKVPSASGKILPSIAVLTLKENPATPLSGAPMDSAPTVMAIEPPQRPRGKQKIISRPFLQVDSDSGISMSIPSEEQADGPNISGDLNDDINKLISFLASPLKAKKSPNVQELPSVLDGASIHHNACDISPTCKAKLDRHSIAPEISGETLSWKEDGDSSLCTTTVLNTSLQNSDISESRVEEAGRVRNVCLKDKRDTMEEREDDEYDTMMEMEEGEDNTTMEMEQDEDNGFSTIPPSECDDQELLCNEFIPPLSPFLLPDPLGSMVEDTPSGPQLGKDKSTNSYLSNFKSFLEPLTNIASVTDAMSINSQEVTSENNGLQGQFTSSEFDSWYRVVANMDGHQLSQDNDFNTNLSPEIPLYQNMISPLTPPIPKNDRPTKRKLSFLKDECEQNLFENRSKRKKSNLKVHENLTFEGFSNGKTIEWITQQSSLKIADEESPITLDTVAAYGADSLTNFTQVGLDRNQSRQTDLPELKGTGNATLTSSKRSDQGLEPFFTPRKNRPTFSESFWDKDEYSQAEDPKNPGNVLTSSKPPEQLAAKKNRPTSLEVMETDTPNLKVHENLTFESFSNGKTIEWIAQQSSLEIAEEGSPITLDTVAAYGVDSLTNFTQVGLDRNQLRQTDLPELKGTGNATLTSSKRSDQGLEPFFTPRKNRPTFSESFWDKDEYSQAEDPKNPGNVVLTSSKPPEQLAAKKNRPASLEVMETDTPIVDLKDEGEEYSQAEDPKNLENAILVSSKPPDQALEQLLTTKKNRPAFSESLEVLETVTSMVDLKDEDEKYSQPECLKNIGNAILASKPLEQFLTANKNRPVSSESLEVMKTETPTVDLVDESEEFSQAKDLKNLGNSILASSKPLDQGREQLFTAKKNRPVSSESLDVMETGTLMVDLKDEGENYSQAEDLKNPANAILASSKPQDQALEWLRTAKKNSPASSESLEVLETDRPLVNLKDEVKESSQVGNQNTNRIRSLPLPTFYNNPLGEPMSPSGSLCTPRRSCRSRKATDKFQSPLNSLGLSCSPCNYRLISPRLTSRKMRSSYSKREENSPLSRYGNSKRDLQQFYQCEEIASIDVGSSQVHASLVSSDENDHFSLRRSYSPLHGEVSGYGRLSDSFEIISPIKTKTQVDHDLCFDSSPRTPSKSPIILRIRRKKKRVEAFGEEGRASTAPESEGCNAVSMLTQTQVVRRLPPEPS